MMPNYDAYLDGFWRNALLTFGLMLTYSVLKQTTHTL